MRTKYVLYPVLLISLLVTTLLVSGQPVGNVVSAATGDNAIFFGGDGYVEVPYSPSLSPTNAITIEAWVKRSATDRNETLVGNGQYDSYWFGFSSSGKLSFTPESLLDREDGNAVVSAGKWTHVAVTYDGATRCYYINGVLDTTITDNAGPPGQAGNGQELGIGLDLGIGGANNFMGLIDNVRLWSNVRSGEQIRNGMFQSIQAPSRGLIAEWTFDGDATDAVGGHDGIVHGSFTAFDNEGAIPHDIRIPQIAVTPSLDGFCYSSEYGSAIQVTLNGTSISLLHTDTDLWICFDGLATSASTASVYLDASHTRVDPAQPEHLRLTVYTSDTTGAQVGTGGGAYTDTVTADGLWDGKYRLDPTGGFDVYRAEFRIDDDLLGGWEHVIGLALAQTLGGRGGLATWPALGEVNTPGTWSNATLSGAGSPRTFTGETVYQPRDFTADPVGVAGVRVELIGSDPNGSEAVVAVAHTNSNGTFGVSSSDSYTEHRIEIGDLPRGYLYGSAEADAPGVALDSRTIDYGAAAAGTYPNNVFTLGEFANYAVHTDNGPYFLIVAGQYLIDAGSLDAFVQYKRRLGFEVEVVSIETVEATSTGADLPEKIRELERDRLLTYGLDRFKYLMLVGPESKIPFAQITPWFNGRDSEGAIDLDKCLDTTDTKFKFTDWYYADLLSDFDSNDNGCLLDGFGKTWTELLTEGAPGYIPDSKPQFHPTVSVGRIPIANKDAVRETLSNIMHFEQQSEAFKQRALMAMSYYWLKGQYWSPLHQTPGSFTACPPEKGSGVQGVSKECKKYTEDAAVFAERMKNDFLNGDGYVSTIFYETAKVPGASPVQSPQPLTLQNVLDELEATPYGMVNVGGHGSSSGVGRTYWVDENGNGVLDSPTQPLSSHGDQSVNEIKYAPLINTSGLSSLTPDNEYGAVYIASACSTSYPVGGGSIGIGSVKYGHAVAWVGALNVISVIAPVDEAVTELLLTEDLRLGDAVWQALHGLASHPSRDVWYASANWATTLYGDPTLSYWGNPGGQSTHAAWPMARHDALGTSHNALIGPEVPKVMWTYNATAPNALPLPPSPVLSNNGEVIVAHGSVVDVLRNGTLYQRLDLDAPAFGTPSIAADGTVYAVDIVGRLYAFQYQKIPFWNGSIATLPIRERRWAVYMGSPPSTSPVIGADGFIAVGATDAIRMFRPDGHKVGEVEGMGTPLGGLAVDAHRVVYATTVDSGMVKVDFFCLNGPCVESQGYVYANNTPPLLAHGAMYLGRTNGDVIKSSTAFSWEQIFQADGEITAGPVGGQHGLILVGTANGTLYALTEDLNLKWQRSVGAPVTSIPASSFDAVYIVTGDEMRAYHPYSGVPLWTRDLGSGVGSGSVAVGYGRELYAQTSSGKIIAVGEGWSEYPALFAVKAFKVASRFQVRAEWSMTASPDPHAGVGTQGEIGAQGTSLGFLLQRSADGGEWEDLVILPPGTTVYTDSNIVAGTTYAYRLQVLDSEGNDSDHVSAPQIVQDVPALPGQPNLNAVTTESADALRLAWHSPADDLVSTYRIERAPSAGGPFTTALQAGGEVTTTADTGLAPDTTVYYRVVAVNNTGESAPSNVLSGTTRSLTLPAPQNVSATLSISGYVRITWSPGPSGATAVVEVSEGTQVGYLLLGTTGAAGPYSHYPGEPSTYVYRVKFVLGDDESPYTESGLVVLPKGYELYLPLILRNSGGK